MIDILLDLFVFVAIPLIVWLWVVRKEWDQTK